MAREAGHSAPVADSFAASEETLRDLVRRGFAECEVMIKSGRSRRLVCGLGQEISLAAQECAWAVRASTPRASLLAGGTGSLPSGAGGTTAASGATGAGGASAWPDAAGRPFRLPEPAPIPSWNEPADLAAALIGESEGLRLLASIASALAAELPGARLLHAALEDGGSDGTLANSRGLRLRSRQRLATLHLEAGGPGLPATGASLYLAAREARQFHPQALARRLADWLSLAAGAQDRSGGGSGTHGAAPLLPASGDPLILSPAVAAALLAALLPLLVGPAAAALLAPLRDRRGRIGGERLTIIDNGRLPGGILERPFDAEGVACREVRLVEDGMARQPLLAWWQAGGAAAGEPSGCSRRPGWRDLVKPGPTHLYIQPDRRVSVGSLLREAGRGAYLIEPTAPARYDAVADQLSLPVCGLTLAGGRAAAPIPAAHLCGSAAAFFRGIEGVARDLTFQPLDGMIGSPTLLVTGLALRRPNA